MTILVTGAAGFIGYHVSAALLQRGNDVLAVDNLNDYYPVTLKKARLAELLNFNAKTDAGTFHFIESDFATQNWPDKPLLPKLQNGKCLTGIIHLGAQAGVRYSLENPAAYIQSNLVGHANILELARQSDNLNHLVYASSSSVYGDNRKQPFAVGDPVDTPLSLYAATKRADELLSQSYAHLYRIPQTGLRFFTVYGPWGRPDMAPWLFTDAILRGNPIEVFNRGNMARDFTYIDDIVEGVLNVFDHPPEDSGTEYIARSTAPHRLYNIGNNHPEALMDFIHTIEAAVGKKAKVIFKGMPKRGRQRNISGYFNNPA